MRAFAEACTSWMPVAVWAAPVSAPEVESEMPDVRSMSAWISAASR